MRSDCSKGARARLLQSPADEEIISWRTHGIRRAEWKCGGVVTGGERTTTPPTSCGRIAARPSGARRRWLHFKLRGRSDTGSHRRTRTSVSDRDHLRGIGHAERNGRVFRPRCGWDFDLSGGSKRLERDDKRVGADDWTDHSGVSAVRPTFRVHGTDCRARAIRRGRSRSRSDRAGRRARCGRSTA